MAGKVKKYINTKGQAVNMGAGRVIPPNTIFELPEAEAKKYGDDIRVATAQDVKDQTKRQRVKEIKERMVAGKAQDIAEKLAEEELAEEE